MNFIKKILYNLLFFSLLFGAIGSSIIATAFIYYNKDLPDHKQLAKYEPPVTTRLYSHDGKLMAEYYKENRIYMPISAIPPKVIEAFIAAEDKNFYSHPGVDLISLIRAMAQNITRISQNRNLIGGSTITQQVVKNFLLTNERSISRKIKEAILAFKITRIYSKDKILELYLNQNYLGLGSYGIASAALNYFNKSLDELSLQEIAFLAGVPKAPSTYNPTKRYEKAKARRDWVLERMYEDGYITEEQLEIAQASPIILRRREATEIVKAGGFSEAIRRQLVNKYGFDYTYTAGLMIKTTLEPKTQELAEKSFRRGIEEYDKSKGFRGPIDFINVSDWKQNLNAIATPKIPGKETAVVLKVNEDNVLIGMNNGYKSTIDFSGMKWASRSAKAPSDILKRGDVIFVSPNPDKPGRHFLDQLPEINGAMIVMNPHNGRVLAMISGYLNNDIEFNRALQAKRQTGSVFKPFVYLSALENGFTPASIVDDEPLEIEQGPHLPLWRPKNYSGDFIGPATLRRGLEKSRNVMTVRLAHMIGMQKIMEVTKRFGINQNPSSNLSSVLGAEESTLMQITNAYAIIANGGRRVSPILMEKIQDRHGNVIYKSDNRKCSDCEINISTAEADLLVPSLPDLRSSVIDTRTAYQMTSMLEGAVKRGTSAGAKSIGKTVAGKTGTSNDSKDAWFIGYSPDLVVGIYIGYDIPRSIGKHATGARIALPVFNYFMKEKLKNYPNKEFAVPPGIKFAEIDQSTGMPPTPNTPKRDIVLEAFKLGTEPEEVSQIQPESEYLEEITKDSAEDSYTLIPQSNNSIDGTGGLY